MQAKTLSQESDRLEALKQYEILGTPSEQTYDDITALAAFICNAPIALISLVDSDRQWFKSKQGLNVDQTSREVSFCSHAILGEDIMVVEDALKDRRFDKNPLVTCAPNIRFYAGVPLLTSERHALGTLCVIDKRPRKLSKKQQAQLKALARQVVVQLEYRRVSFRLADALSKIERMNGLIPICSYCKGIRNDDGFWSSIEQFIEQHSEAELTHGICDACMQTHYPEAAKVWKAQKKTINQKTSCKN